MNLIITGSTGIAAATAKLAASTGASIFLVSFDETSCAELAQEIKSTSGVCEYFVGDLTAEQTASTAVTKCLKDFARIDGLFNVAGISGRKFGDGPIHECSPSGWDATLDANAKTTFLMARAVLPQMMRQVPDASGVRGAILNMASVLALSPEPTHFAAHAYAASKGAIISLTKAMASYYAAQQIRVNAIAPGLVRTPMSKRAQDNPAITEYMKTKQPLAKDLLEPADIAQSALFLLSASSRHITGEIMKIDAGWSISS